MRVLLNDGMDEEGLEVFKAAGIEADTRKRDIGKLVDEIGGFDGLVVRSATKVTRDVIEAGVKGNLIIIGRAGVGYDNVDVSAASEYGIVVKYAPHGNTNATAELAIALMLSVSRNTPQAHSSLVNGIWRKKEFQGRELSHKTLGIIGCGRVGQRLSQLVIGFDMEVIGYDPVKDPDSRINYTGSIDDVLGRADYVSIHAAGNGRPIIGEREINMMKPGAYLINASRGQNIDEKALYDALSEGKIAGAALDVYSEEPAKEGGGFANKLRELPNVVMTPHLGASTDEAQRKTSREMADAIVAYLRGDYGNAINVGETVQEEKRPTYPIVMHHLDVPGAFQQISAVLAGNGINIRENPSRRIGNGSADSYVTTVYLVHQIPEPHVLKALEALPIVRRARSPGMANYSP